jgi:hypothetical protein
MLRIFPMGQARQRERTPRGGSVGREGLRYGPLGRDGALTALGGRP